ncbi:Uncharacterised protein [Mycobacteroides abscessus subsp. abscessus]|nr:Uncharacterised protein [Mycobacteroides abscessus subsp. abscessus]
MTPLLGLEHSADVDHYFPHSLMARGVFIDLDDVWNLVLACAACNRGPGGKFHRLPHGDFLERLWTRNEMLISSHHPSKKLRKLPPHSRTETNSSKSWPT